MPSEITHTHKIHHSDYTGGNIFQHSQLNLLSLWITQLINIYDPEKGFLRHIQGLDPPLAMFDWSNVNLRGKYDNVQCALVNSLSGPQELPPPAQWRVKLERQQEPRRRAQRLEGL